MKGQLQIAIAMLALAAVQADVTVPTSEAQLRQALIKHLAKVGFTLVESDNHTLLFVRRGTLHRSPDNPQVMERLLYVTTQRSNNTTVVKGKAELSIKGEATKAVPSQYAEKYALEAETSVKK